MEYTDTLQGLNKKKTHAQQELSLTVLLHRAPKYGPTLGYNQCLLPHTLPLLRATNNLHQQLRMGSTKNLHTYNMYFACLIFLTTNLHQQLSYIAMYGPNQTQETYEVYRMIHVLRTRIQTIHRTADTDISTSRQTHQNSC